MTLDKKPVTWKKMKMRHRPHVPFNGTDYPTGSAKNRTISRGRVYYIITSEAGKIKANVSIETRLPGQPLYRFG